MVGQNWIKESSFVLENRLAKEESMLIAAGVLTWALVAWLDKSSRIAYMARHAQCHAL